ncbi:hypothetical protein PFISCL1PPCAC_10808, partial [Pristionchus fissidentatus]
SDWHDNSNLSIDLHVFLPSSPFQSIMFLPRLPSSSKILRIFTPLLSILLILIIITRLGLFGRYSNESELIMVQAIIGLDTTTTNKNLRNARTLEYDLGAIFRDRYVESKFIDERYKPKELNIISHGSPSILSFSSQFISSLFISSPDGFPIPPVIHSPSPNIQLPSSCCPLLDSLNSSSPSPPFENYDGKMENVPVEVQEAFLNGTLIPTRHPICSIENSKQIFSWWLAQSKESMGPNAENIQFHKRLTASILKTLVERFRPMLHCHMKGKNCGKHVKFNLYFPNESLSLSLQSLLSIIDDDFYISLNDYSNSLILLELRRRPFGKPFIVIYKKSSLSSPLEEVKRVKFTKIRQKLEEFLTHFPLLCTQSNRDKDNSTQSQ